MRNRSMVAHPEIVIGIPPMVVCSRLEYKRKWAEVCGYEGPLTLAEAVDKGRISQQRAEQLVAAWEQARTQAISVYPPGALR